MSRLLRAGTLTGTPVVTLGGESPLEVKDVVFGATSGEVVGFTLRKHGFLGGPVSEVLEWTDVHGLGPDAVVVRDEDAFSADGEFDDGRGDVLGADVLTESGKSIGQVVEVVLKADRRHADVVGFEIEPSEEFAGQGDRHVFLPLPDAIAVSGERVIVPDRATDYIRDDLAGFGSAVEEFRSMLDQEATT